MMLLMGICVGVLLMACFVLELMFGGSGLEMARMLSEDNNKKH